MATIGIVQILEDFSNSPDVDLKEPSSVEVQIDESPNKLTDVLSPDLFTSETDSVVRQLGYEGDEPNEVTASPPMAKQDTQLGPDQTENTEADQDSVSDSSITSSLEASLPSIPEVDNTNIPATANPDHDSTLSDRPSERLALHILDIIQRYGHSTNNGNGASWAGKTNFLPLVERSIQKGEAVKMVLPAFPCKSNNKVDKVLGTLPDMGEELALTHLNGLGESISEVYEHGAQIVITSDGLVYNDILNISDSDVWDYSSAVRDIIKIKDLRHITTLRIVDLLGYSRTDELTRDEYLTHAGCYRRELTARFAPANLDTRGAIRNEPDTCMTYTGYVKFLLKDLRHSCLAKDAQGQKLSGEKYKLAVKRVAMAMIERGKTFAAAIEANCRDHVRLSIHPSTGQTKLSISMIPQPGGGNLMTPWHSAIAVGLNGSYKTVHVADVRDTHGIIYRNGNPHHLREKSDLWDFGNVKVDFEHLYPCGLIIKPAIGIDTSSPPSLRDVDVVKVRKLAELQSPVVLRGFADTTDRDLYIKKAEEMGEILPWMFGKVMVVKDQKKIDRASNNVASNEAMPMHYDGIFKFRAKNDDDGNVLRDEEGNEMHVQIPPRFQMFSAYATAPKGSGYTLFAESRLFFQYLPPSYTLSRLQAVKWRLLSVGYWRGKMQNMSLVVPHPVTSVPCLRWHESWPESKTKYSTCEVKIENDDQTIVDMVDKLMYDRRVCLRFGWEQGDILIADNSSMMHTRTAFGDECERELWRIHLDEMEVNLCNEVFGMGVGKV